MPFTNNRGEQALPMVNMPMKISDGFRTRASAECFVPVRGILETARKQDLDLLAVLQPDSGRSSPYSAAKGLQLS